MHRFINSRHSRGAATRFPGGKGASSKYITVVCADEYPTHQQVPGVAVSQCVAGYAVSRAYRTRF